MSDVLIQVHCEIGGQRDITMPGATSVKYAAKRAAEAFEFNEDAGFWGLVKLVGGHQGMPPLIPEDDVIAGYVDTLLGLVMIAPQQDRS